MPKLMRCLYCGALQDEPVGVKSCVRCGGELTFEKDPPAGKRSSYIQVQMELDQVNAPTGRNVDRYLLVTIHTPATVPPEEAAATTSGRAPISFAAALDTSGSMQGEKIDQAKEAVRQAFGRLQDGDAASLVIFNADVRTVVEPVSLNGQVRRTVESALHEINASGMTALCGGLELGIEKAAVLKQETNLVLLLSDGQANVGETDLEKVGARGRAAREQGITVSTLGVGSDYNEALMAEIATQGGGRFYHVQHAGQIVAYLTGELGEMTSLAARDAVLHLNLPAGALISSLSAAYPVVQSGTQATVTVGGIPSNLELEIPLRLTLPAQAEGTKSSVDGTFTYRSPAGNQLETPLNRVTVRFVEAEKFGTRDGVVQPVAERVFSQLKAASVMGVVQAQNRDKKDGVQRAEAETATLEGYAAILGEEAAEAELEEAKAVLGAVQASPAVAKKAVADAVRKQRSSRDFTDK